MRRSSSVRSRRSSTMTNRIGQIWLNKLEDRSVPATITVSSVSDAIGVNGSVSLREAINSINGGANLNGDVVAVGAYGTADTILFNSTFNVAQTINMSGHYAISKAMAITGPGSGLLTVNSTAAQGDTSRIFNITSAASITGMKITGGNTITAGITGRGGAILTTANVTLTDVVVIGNTSTTEGGAIAVNAGVSLTLTKSTVTGNISGGNGGGIRLTAGANMVITDSTVSNNTAAKFGGGLYFFNDGSLTMTRSTISGNDATGGKGGGLYLFANTGLTANITNSTISGNTSGTAGGGIYSNGAGAIVVNIKNSTIAFNTAATYGGGIFSVAVVTNNIDSTIVSNNTAAGGFEINGNVNANFSLIGDAVGDSSGATITGANNQIDVDPLLDVLALNGAPAGTPLSHNLKAGSAAINTGSNVDGLSTDQRGAGFPRVQGKAADIGALETPDPAPSAGGTSPNVSISGGLSHTVTVVFSDLVGSKLINQGTIATGAITISGPGGFTATPTLSPPTVPNVDAPSITATFTFTPPVNGAAGWDNTDNGTYTIKSVGGIVFDKDTPSANSVSSNNIGTFQVAIPVNHIVNATNDESVDSDGKLSLREAIANANTDGGPSSIVFDATAFSGTKTITMTMGEFALSDAFGMSITGPTGGVILDAATLSRVVNVEGSPTGAAIALSNMSWINGLAPAGFNGGGLRTTTQAVTLTNIVIANCSTDSDGGAITVNNGGSLNLTNCTLSSNTATGTGGGINLSGASTVVLTRSSISGNQAGGNGGGVYFYNNGALTVVDSTISGNNSGGGNGGGGIYFFGSASNFLISNSTISGNTTAGGGGGVYLNNFIGTAIVRNSTITLNDAATSGGGFFQDGGAATISSTIIAGNTVGLAATETADIAFLVATNVAGNNSLIGIQDPLTNATFTGSGILAGSLATPLDAKLDPILGLNGAPTGSPFTHALLANSPALNTGNNVAGLANDQRGPGFARASGVSTDIGAFEVQAAAAAAKVTGVAINSKLLTPVDKAQRSYVSDVAITFDSKVAFVGAPVAAFTLDKVGGGSVTLSANVDNSGPGTVVTLTFIGGSVNSTSLADGRYALHALAGQFTGAGLDGDGNGTGGDNFIFDEPASPATLDTAKIFRIFGDYEGDGDVDTADFIQFRLALGNSSPPFQLFDFDNDGAVATSDFIQFRLRFGGSI